MQFNSKTEQQIQEEGLIPIGEYDFTVHEAKDTKSKKSNADMIQLDLDVFVDGSARQLKDWLMEAVAYKLRHFCYSTGLGPKYDAGTLTAQDCVGKSGKVKITQKNSEQYGMQNSVKDYAMAETKTPSDGKPSRPAPAPADDPNSPPF